MTFTNDEFQMLYEKHRESVRRYLVKLSRNEELAEDLSQDVFLRAHAKYDQFDPQKGGSLQWILAIAHNHFVSYVRREGRIEPNMNEWLESSAIGGENPAGQVEMEVLSKAIREVLFALPEPERRILYLMKVKRWTRERIAARLNIGTRTVSRKLVSAIELLRLELEKRQLMPA